MPSTAPTADRNGEPAAAEIEPSREQPHVEPPAVVDAAPVVAAPEPSPEVAVAVPPPAPEPAPRIVPAPPRRSRPGPLTVPIDPTRDPEVLAMRLDTQMDEEGFAANAFPPTMPDTEWHRAGWITNDCLRCHETGVAAAPIVRHDGLPEILMAAKCRTCHVIATGQAPTGTRDNAIDPRFEANAFPPMIPNSESHRGVWTSRDCLLCHESGVRDAPIVRHEGLPTIYLRVKCRTCHVQVRSHETDPWPPGRR